MTLKDSNPYLRRLTVAQRRAALRVSVETSSAVEGIRAPFASGLVGDRSPSNKADFIAYWRQRAAESSR